MKINPWSFLLGQPIVSAPNACEPTPPPNPNSTTPSDITTQVCLFVLRFYGPINPMWSCRARSVYLTTHLLGRLSPLSGSPVLCTFFCQKSLPRSCPMKQRHHILLLWKSTFWYILVFGVRQYLLPFMQDPSHLITVCFSPHQATIHNAKPQSTKAAMTSFCEKLTYC